MNSTRTELPKGFDRMDPIASHRPTRSFLETDRRSRFPIGHQFGIILGSGGTLTLPTDCNDDRLPERGELALLWQSDRYRQDLPEIDSG